MTLPTGVLGLDPSSTRTGYAVLTDEATIVEAGYLDPDRVRDPAEIRTAAMVDGLERLLALVKVPIEAIILETVSRHTGGRHGGGGAGLATYGFAVGAVWQFCRSTGLRIRMTTPEEWTRNRTKADRITRLMMRFPMYREALRNDRGGDLADAIGLCVWHYATPEDDDAG